MEVTLQRRQKKRERRVILNVSMIRNGGERFADLVSRFEYGEWIQHEADGDAGRGTRKEVPGIREYRENGGMTFGVSPADRCKERRGGHESTDLIQAGKVHGETGDVSGIRNVRGRSRSGGKG
jgi:hypothetical protein